MLGLLAAIALTVLPGSGAPAHIAVVPCPAAEAGASTTAREARAVRCLLNAERTARSLPRLYVSPHSCASLDGYLESVYDIFLDNLDRYLAHKPLHHVVDLATGYGTPS